MAAGTTQLAGLVLVVWALYELFGTAVAALVLGAVLVFAGERWSR